MKNMILSAVFLLALPLGAITLADTKVAPK